MNCLLLLSCSLLLLNSINAFAPLPSLAAQRCLSQREQQQQQQLGTTGTTTLMAGFGSPSKGSGGKKKKKEQKLKPKQQWDRYISLKKETMVRVAVQGEEDDNNDWLEVGRVKSKDNANTEIAVAKQRVIIAEHSRRLYPLQMTKDTKVQWAYWKEEGESTEWVVVDKSVLEGAPANIEKEIGFEGRPDPSTGFYCMYKEGRLVE